MVEKQNRKQFIEDNSPKKIAGVFKVTNLANGKIFLGSDVDLKSKRNSLFFQLNANSTFMNKELQADWTQLGEEQFTFEIIDELKIKEGEIIDVKKELKSLLNMWFEELSPFGEAGYNKKI